MNILHVIAGLPPGGGGLSEVVPRIALETARLGHDVTIATVATPHEPISQSADAVSGEVRIVRFAPSPPRFLFYSYAMRRGLANLVAAADVVHVHSNWTFPVWWGCFCAVRHGKALVVSPHGGLAPMARAHSSWKKRLAGPVNRWCLRRATVIHATSDAERTWIGDYLGGRPPVAVIPNGVDAPAPRRLPKPEKRSRRVLFLGRLHPLKGLDLLIEAWSFAVAKAGEGWELVIAGPDERGTCSQLESSARRLGIPVSFATGSVERDGQVVFCGPLYGDDKQRAFDAADLVVLPSRSENFGMVVAEAMANGIPVITTKATPWEEVHGLAGWWVDVDARAIGEAMSEAMALDDSRRAAMGDRGLAIIKEKYQWSSIGKQAVSLYESISSASGCPL